LANFYFYAGLSGIYDFLNIDESMRLADSFCAFVDEASTFESSFCSPGSGFGAIRSASTARQYTLNLCACENKVWGCSFVQRGHSILGTELILKTGFNYLLSFLKYYCNLSQINSLKVLAND